MSRTRSRRDGPDRARAAAICPDCGAEFIAGITACSDCGGSLVAPRPDAERLTSPEGLVPVGGAFGPGVGREVAAAFDRGGIAHYLEPVHEEVQGEFGPVPIYQFVAYVRPEEYETALRLYHDLDGGTSREETSHTSAQPPSLRDLMTADVGLPAAPTRNTGRGHALHGIAVLLWLGCIGALTGGRLLLSVACAITALVLHAHAARIGRGWRAEWDERARVERQQAAATDWEAIEAEQHRRVMAAERAAGPTRLGADDLDAEAENRESER
ncbi:MAG: hypothetical protein AAF791_14795 [Bacteroidota bacterium]